MSFISTAKSHFQFQGNQTPPTNIYYGFEHSSNAYAVIDGKRTEVYKTSIVIDKDGNYVQMA